MNVDVCLSVTKYHREEWQAAWTIRTILEAIIAFFPIKEDHDAIGAIDYPTEARKKLAVASRKWKCETCGPIIDLLPDKKSRKDSNCAPEDSKSDSSAQNQEKSDGNSNEPKHSKREKSKLKKMDIDRKSLLSNIDGVILEDVNEDMENEEDTELKRLQTLQLNHPQVIKKESTQVAKDDCLKRSNSDNTHTHSNFSEYLKKLRLSKFEEEEESEIKQTSNNVISSKENKDKYFKETEIVQNNSENINKNEIEINFKVYAEASKNIFVDSTREEVEFSEIMASMSLHKPNATNDEILKELYKEKVDSLLKGGNGLLGEVVNRMISQEVEEKRDLKVSNAYKPAEKNQNIREILSLLNDKDKLDSLKKQKNNALKYITRMAYSEAKLRRLRCINAAMIVLIICIFLLYYLGRNYL